MTEQQPVPHPTFQDSHGQTWYVWKDTAVLPHVADMYTDRKRLTDAELAAEFHGMDCERLALRHDGYESRQELERAWTFLKFATLPHASANGYQ